jgi:hypothetical protein
LKGWGRVLVEASRLAELWSIFVDHVYALRMLKPRAMRRLSVTCREWYSAFRQKHMLAIDWYS